VFIVKTLNVLLLLACVRTDIWRDQSVHEKNHRQENQTKIRVSAGEGRRKKSETRTLRVFHRSGDQLLADKRHIYREGEMRLIGIAG